MASRDLSDAVNFLSFEIGIRVSLFLPSDIWNWPVVVTWRRVKHFIIVLASRFFHKNSITAKETKQILEQ